jgi:peroxiredoxin
MMTPEVKKLLAAVAAIVVAGFLAARYLVMLRPAAEREATAACRGLRPSEVNKSLATAMYPGFPRPAPDITVQDYTGHMRKLSSYRGKVVFLNFWATWCPPCLDEVPSIEALQRQLGDDGFVVVALASSPDWQPVREFFPNGTNMTVLLDPPARADEQLGAMARYYGVPALPETFVIDREGWIRYYYANKRDWHSDVAVTCLRSLLEEESSLAWLKSWLSTTSRTSSGS